MIRSLVVPGDFELLLRTANSVTFEDQAYAFPVRLVGIAHPVLAVPLVCIAQCAQIVMDTGEIGLRTV